MKRLGIIALVVVALSGSAVRSQNIGASFVALGDSIGEGVQSADANVRTQTNIMANLIAQQMGVSFPLPLIDTSPSATIFSTEGRRRIFPNVGAFNLAVSGATISDLLNNRFQQPIDTETDLVLMPRTGSQMEIAEQLHAPFNLVWIGSNDVDAAVLQFDHLDASQMTDVASFTSDFTNMVNRFKAMNTKVVVGTIPDVTKTGFVLTGPELQRLVGSDFGLPQGSFTTLPEALLIKIGEDDGSNIQDPNYVLDPQEIAAIQTRTQELNNVITQTASAAGFAVVDIWGTFLDQIANPPVFFGVPLTPRFQGGLLSMDGFHPSNIEHALAANRFIEAANARYGLQIPAISQDGLNQIAANDPFIDWNGNYIIRGRPLAGLLETIGPFIGISGDYTEGPGSARFRPAPGRVDKRLGEAFKQQYLLLKGLPASTPWTKQTAVAAMREVFGLKTKTR